MDIPGKEIWYDWGGANVWLFKQVNSFAGYFYDKAVIQLSHMADYHRFPYYLVGLLVFALLSLIVRKAARTRRC